jgi:hypothetical protein
VERHDGTVISRLLIGAVAAALALAACGDDGDGASGPTTQSATTEAASWCNELSDLMDATEVDDVRIDGAPDEIVEPLQTLLDGADVDPDTAPEGTVVRLYRALVTVQAWDHQHCGGEHPFCPLLLNLDGAIAAGAFADTGEGGGAAVIARFVDEVGELLTEQVPPELRGDLETFMASLDGPMSTAEERAAEAASDSLDAWADDNCEVASALSEP